jgi:hypothetical protein
MGHSAERYYVQQFNKLGYSRCITSRKGSRIHDDSLIDLIFIPFNVQIKAGKQRGFNPMLILIEMDKRIKENFPEDHEVHSKPKIVILKKEVGRGTKRSEFDELVTMTFKDFTQLITINNENNNT